MDNVTLKQAITLLTRYCPTERAVMVVRAGRLRHWADCQVDSGGVTIRLSSALDRVSLIETLAHEWAHAMTWGATKVDHGTIWGVAYARCYRVLVDGWRPRR